MADLVNLHAESGRDIISDDATPTLTLKNASTGTGLNVVGGAAAEAAIFTSLVTGGATIAPLRIVASTASQAALSFSGVFLSTASINLAANKVAFVVPVYHETQKIWGYLAASVGVS